MTSDGAPFAEVAAVADAVLYEGYLLYPYRPDALKNTYRHLLGMLMPPAWAAMEATEPDSLQAQVVVLGEQPRVRARARFLTDGTHAPHEVDATVGRTARRTTVDADAAALQLEMVALPVGADVGAQAWIVTARLANASDWTPAEGSARDDAARHGLAGAHVLLHVTHGAFISATDPPQALRQTVRQLRNRGCWPVLAGPPGSIDVMLASPVILPDHPTVAGSATGDLFDATEIEELLTLRLATLTESEQHAARQADPRVAEVMDRHAQLQPDALDALHRAARLVRGGLERPDGVRVNDGRVVVRGSEVILRPARRADAQDMLLAGRRATVTGVVADAEGEVHVAVVVHDGGHDLKAGTGRYLYFAASEIEPAS